MPIGIFGGSFNPLHNGHISLANRLLSLAKLDEIWFVVSPQNPLKRRQDLLDDDTRLEMVRMALQNEPKLSACDIEFRLPKPSYTWHTLQALKSENPDKEFTLLMGADNWQIFPKWYHYEKILNNYSIIIYPRTGSTIDISSLPSNVKLIDTGLINISSTQIRQLISQNKPINNLVPKSVAKIIQSRELYK